MLIHFKNSELPKRVARRLRSLLPSLIPYDIKDATAYVFGWENWAMLMGQIGNSSPSIFDEDCTAAEFDARRKYQAERLAEFLAKKDIEADAAQIINLWRPSAGHPQEDAGSAEHAEAWRKGGNENKLLQMLRNLEATGRMPEADELSLILRGLRYANKFTSQLACTYAGPIAVKLVNGMDQSDQSVGLRLLESMVANDDVFARVSLATALARGWGGKFDKKRALNLAKSVLEEIFINDCSNVELFVLVAELSMDGAGGSPDRTRALKMLECAAALGHRESAFNAALFYDDEPAEETRGVVAPDPGKAYGYYLTALHAGYFRARSYLPSLICRHPSSEANK